MVNFGVVVLQNVKGAGSVEDPEEIDEFLEGGEDTCFVRRVVGGECDVGFYHDWKFVQNCYSATLYVRSSIQRGVGRFLPFCHE